jgi:uncharacterized protein
MCQAPRMADLPAVTLRDPAHQVSPRAVTWWRVAALLGDAVPVLAAGVAYAVWSERPWWATLALLGVVVVAALHVAFMPSIRFRIHRWEVTPTAIHTRAGWITTETRIAPLSRVQTVDSHQTGLMRLFDLASLTVTTASAAGPISIVGLDAGDARRLVAQLTEITGASEGDAT